LILLFLMHVIALLGNGPNDETIFLFAALDIGWQSGHPHIPRDLCWECSKRISHIP
jgi:hypothetical protein